MIEWLNNGRGEFREQPVKLYANHELLVTRTGHVDGEAGSRKLHELILDEFRKRRHPKTIAELQAELRKLSIPSEGSQPAVRTAIQTAGPDGQTQQIHLVTEPGVEIAGRLYIPRGDGRKPAVLLVADKTSSYWIPSTSALAERIAKRGVVVLELEPRDSSGEGKRPFVGNWLTNSRANQIGRNLPAMRAHDIVRGIDVLAARADVDPAAIRAIARGVKGVWLLLAAAADTRIGGIWLDRTPHSLRAALEQPMNTDLFEAVIPGFALHWDLEDLAKAMGSRAVLWTDPTRWMTRPVGLINVPAGGNGSRFRYRYILGDDTDHHDDQDNAFLDELIR